MATVSARLHEDEIPIDSSLVRGLVDRTFPAFSRLPLQRLGASGSTNALFRLGDELLVRLPRQPGGTATIEKEQRWLAHLAPELPVAVPETVGIGAPDLGYSERWSIVRWLDGHVPSVVDLSADGSPERRRLASDLAAVVNALRRIPVPADAVHDPALHWYRCLPLPTQDADTRAAIEACRELPGLGVDLDAALLVWQQSMALPDSESTPTPKWLHGDLLAENLLVNGDRLAALLDFGGLAVGDPTVDLIVGWELLDRRSRELFRQTIGVDETTWLRGRGWALSLAVRTFPYYWATMPDRCRSRVAMLRAVLADAAGR